MVRYANLDGTNIDKGLTDVLRWKLGGGGGPPRARDSGVPAPRVDNDGTPVADPSRSQLTWIGHATFLIQLGGKSVLVDPIFSRRIVTVPRFVEPGLTLTQLPKIDLVLVTHNHRDHMDAPSLLALGKPTATAGDAAPLFVVPAGLGRWFSSHGLRAIELDWWEHHDADGLRITFVPSQHWSQRGALDRYASRWGGYVLEDGTSRVYHSGDTGYFAGFRDIRTRVGPIDAAMLPIGAYEPRWFMKDQHMNPSDAARAFLDLGARRFVAMHWGTFRLTDEQLDEPPKVLRDLWHERSIEPERLAIPAIGEVLAL